MVHQYHGIQGGMKQYVLNMFILDIYFAMNKKKGFRKLCSETFLGFTSLEITWRLTFFLWSFRMPKIIVEFFACLLLKGRCK
jgi:hypothetical protein